MSDVKLSNIQIVLATYNEEHRIRSVLDHLCRHCSHVLVIDNCSSDKTTEIIYSRFPSVKLRTLQNTGTSETPEWWVEARYSFELDYVVFASCSEHLPLELLQLYNFYATQRLVQYIHVPRCSFTNRESLDDLYVRPASLFSRQASLPFVCRCVAVDAIDPELISPHDAFKSQTRGHHIYIQDYSGCYNISHMRPYPSSDLFNKHIAYAKNYAKSKFNGRPFNALLDTILRIILDTLRLARSIIIRRTIHPIVKIEYYARVLMHLYVFLFSILHLYPLAWKKIKL